MANRQEKIFWLIAASATLAWLISLAFFGLGQLSIPIWIATLVLGVRGWSSRRSVVPGVAAAVLVLLVFQTSWYAKSVTRWRLWVANARISDGCGASCRGCGVREVVSEPFGYVVTLEFACGELPYDSPRLHRWESFFVSRIFGTIHRTGTSGEGPFGLCVDEIDESRPAASRAVVRRPPPASAAESAPSQPGKHEPRPRATETEASLAPRQRTESPPPSGGVDPAEPAPLHIAQCVKNRVRVLGFLDAEGTIEPLVRSSHWPHRDLGTDVVSYLEARLPRLRELTWYGPDGAIAQAAPSAAGVHDERDRHGQGSIAIDLAECEGSHFYATAPMRPLKITEVPDGRPPLGAYRVEANERLVQAFWKKKITGGEYGAPPQTDEEITYKLFDRAWRPMRCIPCTTRGTTSFNRAEFSWFEIRRPKGILFVGFAVLNEHVSWATGGNTAVTILVLGPDQRTFSRSWVELASWGD